MRLLLGAGDQTREGFATVDLREETNPTFVCDCRKLEFAPDGSCDELVAEDLLEHFLPWEIHDVLCEWNRVLVMGGTLTLKVPNMAMLGRWLADGFRPDAAMTNIYGAHRFGTNGELDQHHTGWIPETLTRDLNSAGFEVIKLDHALNFTTVARKVKVP